MMTETGDEFELGGISSLYDNGSASVNINGIDNLPVLVLPLKSLGPGFFQRQSGTDTSHVQLLADVANSEDLPAVLVQKSSLRIVDGMHRIEAAKLRGKQSINARFVDCTDEEAFILAVRSNTLHGLPLSRADRISGAERILAWHHDWSNRAVAAVAGLSAKTIADLRRPSADDAAGDSKRLGRDGKRRPVTGVAGRRRATEYLTTHPHASLREVARETDVSIGTVHDIRARVRRSEDPEAVGRRGSPEEQTDSEADAAHDGPAPRNGAGPHANGAGLHANGVTGVNGAGLHANGAGPNGVNGTGLHANGAGPNGVNGAHLHANGVNMGGGRIRNGLAPTWPSMASKLANDPTIKYTDGGRIFLRWMESHVINPGEWDEFIGAVPAHWAEGASLVAQGVSDAWREFADQLREKHDPEC